jgi:hypothetical protein
MKTAWYEAKTGNHQGLVIEEATGRNVAVTYDKADATLIAAAPDLLAALELVNVDKEGDGFICAEAMDQVRAAIARAKGEA